MKSRWSYSALAALLITGSFSMVMADDQKSVNIDEQIQQIESAPPGERYQLMNRFKMQLATMNRQERMHAIEALRSRMQGGSNKQMGSHTHTPMENLPDHVDFHQHNQMMQQGINEQMGHKQGMQEYMHEHPDLQFGSKGRKEGAPISNPSNHFQNPGSGMTQGGNNEGGNMHNQIPEMGAGATSVPQTGSQMPTHGETSAPQTMPSGTPEPTHNTMQQEMNRGTSIPSSSPTRTDHTDTSKMPQSGMTTLGRR